LIKEKERGYLSMKEGLKENWFSAKKEAEGRNLDFN